MKRNTLEATNDNILNSIKSNTYNRNEDVKDFVEALDTIEGNMFISLDARWGEGKTFYVRQIEKTLEYLTKKIWKENQTEKLNNLEPYFQNTILNSVVLEKSYLPIYYNAWLYDNHSDPLMSLLLVIWKICETNHNTDIDLPGIKQKIISLVGCFSLSVNNVEISMDSEKLQKGFRGKDILETVKTAEEIRDMVKKILNEVITEQAEKLVIFIDELDRCRPSFAIEMLERIKHYFDDERIIFIVSINKEQLVHTISKYYGNGFDATGYLNKFFDLNVHMPSLNQIPYLGDRHNCEQFYLTKISEGLSDFYKLSLRDGLIFKQKVSGLPYRIVRDSTAQGCCLSLFVPLIIILDLVDEKEKINFLNGNSDILGKISKEIPAIYNMICRFGSSNDNDRSEQFVDGFEKIKAVYDYTFKNLDREAYNKLVLEVSLDLKKICMKLCNGFER